MAESTGKSQQPADPQTQPEADAPVRADHHGSGVQHPDEPWHKPPKPKGKWRRRLLRTGLVLFALLLVLIAVGPMLLSTGPGTTLVVSLINGQVDGDLEVDDLRLRWLSGQRASGVRYNDPSEGISVDVGEVSLDDAGLFSLLSGSLRLGEVRVVNASVIYSQVVPEAEPTSQAPAAPAPPADARESAPDDAPAPSPFSLPAKLSGSLVFENLSLTYLAVDEEPVRLLLPMGRLDMPAPNDITVDFDLSLRQGQRKGRVLVAGELQDLFDTQGVIQPMQAQPELEVQLQGVPTVALDRFLSGMRSGKGLFARQGVVASVLGEGALNAEGTINGPINQLATRIKVHTPNVTIDLKQERDGSTLVASPQSTARLNLTDQTLAALFPNAGLTLVEQGAGIELSRFAFRLPTAGRRINWAEASLSIQLKGDTNLALRDARGEVIGVDRLQLTGESKSIEERLDFEMAAVLTPTDADGKIKRDPFSMELTVLRPFEKDYVIDYFSPKVPISLADALAGQNGRLVMYLGEELELQADLRGKVIQVNGKPEHVKQFALRPIGRVEGAVLGEMGLGRYRFGTRDEPLKATLMPEAFASLMEMLSGRPGEPALTISQPMNVIIYLRDEERGDISIAKDVEKSGIKRFYPVADQTYGTVTIELTRASVFSPSQKKVYTLSGGEISFKVADLSSNKIRLRADLNLLVPQDAGKQGVGSVLTWQTSVSDILGTDGGIPLDGKALLKQIGMNGGVELKNAPSGLFDSLLNKNGDIASILGPSVEQMKADFTYDNGKPTGLTLRLNWDDKTNGPLPDAGASIKPVAFDIDKNQVLTVRGGQDIEIEARVSPAFGDRWMGKLHPFLLDAKSADRPVQIKIKGSTFRYPLNAPDMKGARVDAQIDLGSVEFGKNALMGKVLDWTKKPGERAVFDPVTVKLADGKVSYEGLGMAVGNVKLKLDGEVDLTDGQIVDMAINVPAESLVGVFKELDGVLPDDFSLPIPMTGSIRKPKFDRDLIKQRVAKELTDALIRKQQNRLKKKVEDEVGKGVAEEIFKFFDSKKKRD